MATLVRLRLVAIAALVSIMSACASHSSDHVPPPPRTALEQRLDEVLKRGQGHSRMFYAARVVDLATGQEVYAVDADLPVTPASNGKLSVDSATLDFFGPDATFKTYLAVDGNDLWIIGTGDPGIGDSMIAKKYGGTTMTVLEHWADKLRAKGISHFSGNLYYYDRTFDDQWTSPTWSRSYITEDYAAPISGLNFNNNCIDVTVRPTEDGQPATYTVVPPTQGVKIINNCKTGKGGADISREIGADVFTLKGATTRKAELDSKAIRNPGAFFADALRTQLAVKGITIDGETRSADKPLGGSEIPPKDKIVAVNETKMVDAIGRINKQSQNNFAEAFCKMLGHAYMAKQGKNEPGSWPAGAEAVKAFLARNNIDSTGLRIVDGSGLSHDDRVTTRLISDIFVTMYKHPYHETFFNSLGISGTDGTIAKRMYDLKGRVHAKTGSINGVKSLSGYVQNDDGHYYVFSFIFNGIRGSVAPVVEMQDNACRVLAAWPKKIELPVTTQPTTRPSMRRRAATTSATTSANE